MYSGPTTALAVWNRSTVLAAPDELVGTIPGSLSHRREREARSLVIDDDPQGGIGEDEQLPGVVQADVRVEGRRGEMAHA